VLFTIEGQHEDAFADVEKATNDLLELVAEHQPGASVERRLLPDGA
jgi:hypothetical protein